MRHRHHHCCWRKRRAVCKASQRWSAWETKSKPSDRPHNPLLLLLLSFAHHPPRCPRHLHGRCCVCRSSRETAMGRRRRRWGPARWVRGAAAVSRAVHRIASTGTARRELFCRCLRCPKRGSFEAPPRQRSSCRRSRESETFFVVAVVVALIYLFELRCFVCVCAPFVSTPLGALKLNVCQQHLKGQRGLGV